MRILFVMDPIGTIRIDKDTTFAFMLEAQRRGHEVWFAEASALSATGTGASVLATPTRVQRAEVFYTPGTPERRPVEDFQVVFVRTDPPFDMDYLYATLLLERADPARTLVVNRPNGLRSANEKLYILNFPSVIPDTLVTRSAAEVRQCLAEFGGKGVIKPLDRMGGSGIFLLREDDPNLSSILETATDGGRELVMMQRYIPEATRGDKRILLIGGEVLGAILRVPKKVAGEFRGNMAVGGQAVQTTLTAADLRIVEAVRPHLERDGLYFVGLDVLGDYLAEVNVTSPTGIQELNRLDGVQAERRVFEWVEANAPA